MISKRDASPLSTVLKSHDGPMYGIAAYLTLSAIGLNPWLTLVPLVLSGIWLGLLDEEVQGAPEKDANALALHGAVLLFALSFSLSSIFSDDLLTSVNALIGIIPGLLVYFVLVTSRSPHIESIFGLGVIGLQVSTSIVIIVAMLSGDPESPGEALRQLSNPAIVVPNDAVILAVFLPFTLYVIKKHADGPAEVSLLYTFEIFLAYLALILSVVTLLLMESRLAILCLAMIALWFLVIRWCRRIIVFAFVLTGAGFSTLFIIQLSGEGHFAEFFLNERLAAWYIGIEASADNPVLGAGPGVFGDIYRTAVEESSTPSWLPLDGRVLPWAHSLYVEALIERGLLGLIAILACFYCAFKQLFHRVGNDESADLSDRFRETIAFSLIVFGVCGALEFTMQRSFVPGTLFLLLGLCACRTARAVG